MEMVAISSVINGVDMLGREICSIIVSPWSGCIILFFNSLGLAWTLFKPIAVFCGTDNILLNIPHIHAGCGWLALCRKE